MLKNLNSPEAIKFWQAAALQSHQRYMHEGNSPTYCAHLAAEHADALLHEMEIRRSTGADQLSR